MQKTFQAWPQQETEMDCKAKEKEGTKIRPINKAQENK